MAVKMPAAPTAVVERKPTASPLSATELPLGNTFTQELAPAHALAGLLFSLVAICANFVLGLSLPFRKCGA